MDVFATQSYVFLQLEGEGGVWRVRSMMGMSVMGWGKDVMWMKKGCGGGEGGVWWKWRRGVMGWRRSVMGMKEGCDGDKWGVWRVMRGTEMTPLPEVARGNLPLYINLPKISSPREWREWEGREGREGEGRGREREGEGRGRYQFSYMSADPPTHNTHMHTTLYTTHTCTPYTHAHSTHMHIDPKAKHWHDVIALSLHTTLYTTHTCTHAHNTHMHINPKAKYWHDVIALSLYLSLAPAMWPPKVCFYITPLRSLQRCVHVPCMCAHVTWCNALCVCVHVMWYNALCVCVHVMWCNALCVCVYMWCDVMLSVCVHMWCDVMLSVCVYMYVCIWKNLGQQKKQGCISGTKIPS